MIRPASPGGARGPARGTHLLSLVSPALAALACSAQAGPAPGRAPLSPVESIELPDVGGRIDHLAVDLARGRLYVAALGNDSVEVVDLDTGTWVRRLEDVPEAQGLVVLDDPDRLVVSSGERGTCEIYDGATLEHVATVSLGRDADNVRRDAGRGRVLVAYGDSLGTIDPATWRTLAPVRLTGGHPEGFQLAADGARAYVNVPQDRAICVVDLERGAPAATWKVEEAAANYPLLIAPAAPSSGEADLCLVGCRSPARLVVRALPDGRPVASLELSGDVDDLWYDARRKRVYAACGEGYIDVFERGSPDTGGVGVLGGRTRAATSPGARTCLFVPERDRLYVAAPRRGGEPARILIFAVED